MQKKGNMRLIKNVLFVTTMASVMLFSCKNQTKTTESEAIKYPATARDTVSDVYYGMQVFDPYRWLENDTSEQTAEWVKQQNEITNQYLSKIPYRQQIKDRLVKIWDYPRSSAPFKKANKFFYFKNDGLQNQSVMFYRNSLTSEDVELLNPNKLAEDGTAALAATVVSDDGKYLAYSISNAGSDWQEIFVKNIETLETLADNIKWVKFSNISWYKNGFFYARYPEPSKGQELSGVNENSKIYYHELGTKQSEDKLIYENIEKPQLSYSTQLFNNSNYLMILITQSTSGNALYAMDLTKNNSIIKIVDYFEDDFEVIDQIGNKIFVQTNHKAEKGKIIEIDLLKPQEKNWKDIVIPEKGVIQSVSYIKNKFIVNTMEDAHSVVKIYDLTGKFLYNLDNSEIGSYSGFLCERDDDFTFYTFNSFTQPSTIYKYDVVNNKSILHEKSKIDFNSDLYETKQIFYTSKDKTTVPMFITYKKGINLDGTNPTILYGYGGFNISLTPGFSISRCIWLEQGGIIAVANIRGGGEYGEAWHKAGTIMQKQNVFDDFIAAAEYLIQEKYTSPVRLAIQGGSNGGLLVGAVANQRPDLFAVALPAVGVMDMLRYHKFTIGRYWATDYGTSEDNEDMFKYLYAYSPIHNIKEGVEYPATLVTTADHDDRVVPAHSFKYIATLQYNYKGMRPMIVRIETKAGHGAGKPTMKTIEEITDLYSFTFYNMGYTPIYNK